MNDLKKRLQAGECVHGCWLNMGSSVSAEIVSSAGFDWLLIDLEHGVAAESSLLPQLQAMDEDAMTPIVRVESFELPRVKRILDTGVKGLMFPQIQDGNEARQAIGNMYYPPKGKRGFAKMVRATKYGKEFDEYYEFAKNGLLGVVQIETKESLNHLDDIASIEGVDVLFLGPADLSLALGIFGQWDHPEYIAAVKAIKQAAEKAGKAAGVLFLDVNQYDFYYQHGYRFLACGADMAFLRQGAYDMAEQLRDRRLNNENKKTK